MLDLFEKKEGWKFKCVACEMYLNKWKYAKEKNIRFKYDDNGCIVQQPPQNCVLGFDVHTKRAREWQRRKWRKKWKRWRDQDRSEESNGIGTSAERERESRDECKSAKLFEWMEGNELHTD